MDKTKINGLRDLQNFIIEQGLGGKILPVHASKLSPIDAVDGMAVTPTSYFAQTILEPEIVDVSRDLFESGFLNQAVDEAFKVVESVIQTKSGLRELRGVQLTRAAFAPDEPRLQWTSRTSQAERDEQRGYYEIFCGAFQGIGTPTKSEIGWISDEARALDCVAIAQHLLRRVKEAHRAPLPKRSEI